MWTKNKAAAALWQLVSGVGGTAAAGVYIAFSLRIGGATHLLLGGCRRRFSEGRAKELAKGVGSRPPTYMCVRSRGRDAMWVSNVLAAGGDEILLGNPGRVQSGGESPRGYM